MLTNLFKIRTDSFIHFDESNETFIHVSVVAAILYELSFVNNLYNVPNAEYIFTKLTSEAQFVTIDNERFYKQRFIIAILKKLSICS